MMKATNTGRPSNGHAPDSRRAFTMVELLVVFAIIAILAGILVPVVSFATENARGTQCQGNLRQIILGLRMYVNDNNSFFPINLSMGADSDQTTNWVAGMMDYNDPSQNTNALLLVNSRYSQLAHYIQNPALYRCPSDHSRQFPGPQGPPRVRSYCMSGAIGCQDLAGDPRGGPSMYLQTYPPPLPAHQWAVYNKEDEIEGNLGPGGTWIFIDVDPDTISSGVFGNVMTSSNSSTWIWKGEMPAKFHNKTCPIAFVDGHVEIHRWSDPSLIPDVTYQDSWDGHNVPDPDVVWLSAHTTVPVQ